MIAVGAIVGPLPPMTAAEVDGCLDVACAHRELDVRALAELRAVAVGAGSAIAFIHLSERVITNARLGRSMPPERAPGDAAETALLRALGWPAILVVDTPTLGTFLAQGDN